VDYGKKYAEQVENKQHERNVLHLAQRISRRYAAILKGRRFRLGTAQKALNLYLKYLWCLGRIPTPPHCPFDNGIIQKLKLPKAPKWTALDSVRDYRVLVDAARAKTLESKKEPFLPIAMWELCEYENNAISD
jgi:hypothetical protein